MNRKIKDLLNDTFENHIAPFFWQHGEDEQTLRHYMQVIEDSGCGAVCVESRPHPDFCGPKWWEDMDIILDEARHRDMKVWILDDSHFPTGYANGVLEKTKNIELFRQSVFSNLVEPSDSGEYHFLVEDYVRPPKLELTLLADIATKMSPPPTGLGQESLLSVVAINGSSCLDLTSQIKDGMLTWSAPNPTWKVFVNGLTRNAGSHRYYINMLLEGSCRLLIDEVYEKHYEHYAADFGKTILGFFSDEPELGNGILYMQNNPLGTPQDLPWSIEVEQELNILYKDEWKTLLPLLWEATGSEEAANFRYHFMNIVTRLVQKNFSHQVSEWCHAHGVEYIGHVIEDEGQHCRTASSLGHYFRSLSGQDMAGIDDIGGQVFPGGEDGPSVGPLERTRNGEFYHYGLANLAASAAAIEPKKKGRAMCEIFGNYGWKEGVHLEKYLADHFLVRGINYFVPHAFSPKAYPDPDCPPHFYANGHNPQYRHFGMLIRYMNRLSHLFSEGRREVSCAVLYHGESEWSGKAMPFEKVTRVLNDCQINCDVIPADVFSQRETYHTLIEPNDFQVNGQKYRAFIIPEADYIPSEVIDAIQEMSELGTPVIFIGSLPKSCTGNNVLRLAAPTILSLEELVPFLEVKEIPTLKINPQNNRIRILYYKTDNDSFMLVNEGERVYEGVVELPSVGKCYLYDAYHNRIEKIKYTSTKNRTLVPITLYPLKSQVIVFDDTITDADVHVPRDFENASTQLLTDWKRSLCKAIAYPQFEEHSDITLPDKLVFEKPEFSGFIRYETTVTVDKVYNYLLEITEAYEGVEVFVNGQSLGIQIAKPYVFDLTDYLIMGANQIAIEVATTLERERYFTGEMTIFEKAMVSEPETGSGITGYVRLLKGD